MADEDLPRRRRRATPPPPKSTLDAADRAWATAACPSASPRRSIPSATTPKLTGAPEGFTLTVREVRLSAGAGFVVAVCGSIMTMPGLPKRPAAMDIDVDVNGKITGLF